MKPYLVFASIALVLYLLVQGLFLGRWISAIPSFTIEIILFLFFITALIYRYIYRFAPQGSEVVSRFYLLSIALKLLGGCSLVTAIIILDKANAVANVVLFLIGYLVFTIAEIAFLIRLKKA